MLTTAYLPLCKVHTYLCYILASFPGSSLGPGNEVRKLRYVLKDAELDGPLWFFLCAAEFDWRDALDLESQLTEEETSIR